MDGIDFSMRCFLDLVDFSVACYKQLEKKLTYVKGHGRHRFGNHLIRHSRAGIPSRVFQSKAPNNF